MKRNLLIAICLMFIVQIGQSQIVITEISYNPPESGADSLEYIELYNNSDDAINLDGYFFSKGVQMVFPDMELASEAYIVVAKNDTAMQNVFGITSLKWTDGALSNGGEQITLNAPDSSIVDDVEFSDEGDWPGYDDGTDSAGGSIELCDVEADNNVGTNWSVSDEAIGVTINNKEVKGTPLAANNASCALSGDYTIVSSGQLFTPSALTIYAGESVLWENGVGTHNVNGTIETYPNNPEGFTSGTPSGGNWQFLHVFTIPGEYKYRCDPHAGLGMVGTITVLEPEAPEYPLYDIATVTTENAEGVADSSDVNCTLEGVVYGVNLRPGGLQFTLIDSDGNGIGVFSENDNFDYVLTEGDELSVFGNIGQFNGLTQIYIAGVNLISSDNNLLNETVVTNLSEDSESKLVKLENVTLVDPTKWKEQGNSFNIDVTDGTNVNTLRIDKNVVVDMPEGTFSIVGIGGQYDSSSPYDDGYQLFPRYNDDITLSSGSNNYNGTSYIELSPNPAIDFITVSSELELTSYELFTIEGKRINKGVDVTNIDVSELNSGVYFIRIASNNKMYNSKFIKI